MTRISTASGILLAICILSVIGCKQHHAGKIPVVVVDSPEDIQVIDDLSTVPLVVYHNQISLNGLPVSEKKERFIHMILPSVLAAREDMQALYSAVDQVLLSYHKSGTISNDDSLWLSPLQKSWSASDYWDLRRRLKPNPVSLILAQAAIESGWGESRMFREANNLFGVWSNSPDQRRIRATATRGSQVVYLKLYSTVYESVWDHLKTIGSVRAYREFRNARINNDNSIDLAGYLNRYSELGSRYVGQVRQMIRQNNLTVYDSASLNPSYSTEALQSWY